MVGEQVGGAALARLADQSHRGRRDATRGMCFGQQVGQIGAAPFEVSPENSQGPASACRARPDRFETGFCGPVEGLALHLETFELRDGHPRAQLDGVLGSKLDPGRPTRRRHKLTRGDPMPSCAAAGERHGDKHPDGHRSAHGHDTVLSRSAPAALQLGFPPTIDYRAQIRAE